MAEYRQARPTSYNGVMLRSRSEACYAKWLVSVLRPGIDVEYEPQQYAVGDYTPDFSYEYNGCKTVIEYKPADVSDSYLLWAKSHAEILCQRVSESGSRFQFFICCGSFYEDIPVVEYSWWTKCYDQNSYKLEQSDPFMTESEWLGRFVSFYERQQIARTRWDLR